ncbi:MAG: CoA transferase, partial [Dehalococcoidia bacterium]
RLAHRRELDAIVAEWTRRHDPQEAMRLLQEAKVAAGAVQTTADLLQDPQLQSRGAFRKVPHPLTGESVFRDIPWKLSGVGRSVLTHAPLLGEHNSVVLGGLLGLSESRVDELREGNVIGDRPLAA